MKIRTVLFAAVLCFGCGYAAGAPLPNTGKKVSARAAGPESGVPNWLMDGGTNQRSGWQKVTPVLTKQNIKNLKLLWTVKTGNQVRAMASLMAPLVVQNVPTSQGPKQLVIVVGSSDNLYAIDAATGKMVWQRHFTYPPSAVSRRRPLPPGESPAHLNFLGPGGSTDTPAIGPADASGHRRLYIVDGGGFLHTIDVSTGKAAAPKIPTGPSKFSLQLYHNQIIFVSGRNGVVSVNIASAHPKVMHTVGFGGGGGLWGRRGPAIDFNGTVWTTVGDGIYNPSNPNHLILGDSVIGFAQQPDGSWKIKNWFTPDYWAWLQKRDLDWNNTPTIFRYDGQELMAAAGKECRLYLLNPNDPGGPNHDVPMYKTPLFCNQTADFQNRGSWGALDSWVDSNGTRWVIAPFWGPVSTDIQFPITHDPIPTEGGEAAFKVVKSNGRFVLEPVWLSRDMHRGQPPIVANGMVFAYGSGESTQQAWPDIGLNFDSTIRAAHSGHATIYVLDGQTGKVLWSSGDQVKSFTHFSGLAVADGRVYIGTYDGTFYCFGLPSEETASQ